jgi:hypothetical protein
MKLSGSLLKSAVVVSSVLLVGGFIAYRAGAFNRLMAPTPQPVESSGDPIGDDYLLSGSKSDRIILVPATTQQPAGDKAQLDAALMGGSKTISIGPLVTPPSGSTPGAQSTSTKESTPTLMGGSKYAPIVIPPPPNKSSPQPPSNSPPSK